MDRPIPPFYCVYLLRSTVRHASLYVGSTPNPKRRLREHNGLVAGGAKRTQKASLRPWEMAVVVSGFTSKIAALQFEWAWQNTHITRHISKEDRVTPMGPSYKATNRNGRVTTKHKRPIMSMRDRLLNLRLLLCSHSFRRWPLRVRFFAKDVHKDWAKWKLNFSPAIRPHIQIGLENNEPVCEMQEKEGRTSTESLHHGIDAIDIGYGPMKPYLQKSLAFTKSTGEQPRSCTICEEILDSSTSLSVVCPHDKCEMVSHLTCLSQHFLQHEASEETFLPTNCPCPGCGAQLSWSETVRDLTLRFRGQEHISSVLDMVKSRSAKDNNDKAMIEDVVEGLNEELIIAESKASKPAPVQKPTRPKSKSALKSRKGRKKVVGETSEHEISKPSTPSAQTKQQVFAVIEDSEAENEDNSLD